MSILGRFYICVVVVIALAGVAVGAIILHLFDRYLPHEHEHLPFVCNDHLTYRRGLLLLAAMTLHNVPEGLAVGTSYTAQAQLGVLLAIGIGLHNIPEGISVSVPIFYATGDRKKAFVLSFLSGLAEPLGAGAAYLVMRLFIGGDGAAVPPQLMGVLFGGVAGIMVYISLDELLPTSRAYGKGHDSLLGLVGGMAVMALSLLLMR